MAAKTRARRVPNLATMAFAALPILGPIEPDGLVPAVSLALHAPLNTRSDWHVTAWQAAGDEGRFGDIPAKICFRKSPAEQPESCTSLTHAATNTTERSVFQTVSGLSVVRLVRLPQPIAGVLAQAETNNAAGGGTGTQYALWAYARATDQFRPLATFQLSDQSEFQIVDDGPLAGCIITADYVQGIGESHYGRHRFTVAVHRLDPVTLIYADLLHYTTQAKYPSLDEGGVEMIRREMPETLRILRFIYPKGF